MKTLKPIIEDLRKRNAAIKKLESVRDQAAKRLPDVSDKLGRLPDHEKALRKLALDVQSGLTTAADGAKREAKLRAEGLETAKVSADLKATRAELETTIRDCDESINEQQHEVSRLAAEGKAAMLDILKGRLIDANAEYMAAVKTLRAKYLATFALSRALMHLGGESYSQNDNLLSSRDCLSGLTVSGIDGLVQTPHGLYAFEIGHETAAILAATTAILDDVHTNYPEIV